MDCPKSSKATITLGFWVLRRSPISEERLRISTASSFGQTVRWGMACRCPKNNANRIKRQRYEWFTFLSNPEVKPDNNDAERALRPVVVHRKVSGGARSDWGAKLVAQMFSFLETVRLQSGDAIAMAV